MSSDHPLPTAEATAALAASVAARLQPGSILALEGPMGAGKTTFTRALVEALGGDPACVSSPTYTLLHQYDARLSVVHVDACRLQDAEALEGLGFDEARQGGVAVVEWAELVADLLPPQRWTIRLGHDGQGGRTAQVIPPAADQGATVLRLPAVDGHDPLVRSWLERHASRSAVELVSLPWIGVGLLAAIVGALVGGALGGTAPTTGSLRHLAAGWLGHPGGVVGGVVIATAMVGLVGSRRAVPIQVEPWLGALMVLIGWGLAWDPLLVGGVLASVMALVFVAALAWRLLAVAMGGAPGLSCPGRPDLGPQVPIVTILVPLYREAEVVPELVESLQRLDYPAERLDILFLTEADDEATVAALRATAMPGSRVVVVPEAQPRTKPRACNHGLALARGQFLVIYDAEDRPDPDQIRQAVAVFATQPPTVACLQAHLAWDNHDRNLLTRLFALEYNVWFRRYLPGLVRLGCPVPLGGTSNHFRLDVLRQVGGWDPFNVAEDCDLGLRLHLAGYRTAILDRTTWESAVTAPGPWLRQRTRWYKGYLATALVAMRRPIALMRSLGWRGFPGFLAAIPAVPVLAAAGLLLSALTLVYVTLVVVDLSRGFALATILSERDWAGERWSWPMWYQGAMEHPVFALVSQGLAVVSTALLLGNVLMVAIAWAWGRRPGQEHHARHAWWMPIYGLAQGLAALRALGQAVVSPHRWEKTVHFRRSPPAGGTAESPTAPEAAR